MPAIGLRQTIQKPFDIFLSKFAQKVDVVCKRSSPNAVLAHEPLIA